MVSRSHLPTAATAARRLLRHRGAGNRPVLGSCRPDRAGIAGNRRRTLNRPRRCDVWRRGAGRQASSPMWSLAGPLGSATRRTSSHELQTATSRHAQSVRVAGPRFALTLAGVKLCWQLSCRIHRVSKKSPQPSIDASTRTAPPLSTTGTVDIKLLESICGYDGALAAGSRGCPAQACETAGRGDVFRARWSSPRGWARSYMGPIRPLTGRLVRRPCGM